MNLSKFEKLTKEELRRRADECFAKSKQVSGEAHIGTLLEAQFYTTELDRRHDSRIARRDLLLEIIVIVLIGAEIYMSIRAETLQRRNFADEQTIFQNLQRSSAATADTLESLKATTETMNGAVQKQVELFYDVEVTVTWNQSDKQVVLQNQGRTNVALWGMHIGAEGKPEFFKTANIIAPAGGLYANNMGAWYTQIAQTIQKGTVMPIPFFAFVKNEAGQFFTIKGNFITTWGGDNQLAFNVNTSQIMPGWEMK
jgi:hypothetical protein